MEQFSKSVYYGKEKAKKIIDRIFKAIKKPEMTVLPGHLAYFFFMSIIPMITLFGLFCSMLSLDLTDIFIALEEALPKAVYQTIVPFFTNSKWSLGMSFTTFLAFFLASNAAYSIIVASNTLYKIDKGNEISRRIKAIFMTLVLFILLFLIIVVLAFGDAILNFILNLKILGITETSIIIVSLLKWPLSIFIIYSMVKGIYKMAPDIEMPSKYVTKGAWFTSTLWIIATWIYAFYTNYLASYDMFYGSLSGIIVSLVYIYILAYIMVVGIAINTSYYIEYEKRY